MVAIVLLCNALLCEDENMKKIKNVIVTPGCISCGTCEAICPKVFQVKGTSEVQKGVELQPHAELIEEAEEMCPVQVIKAEWDE